MSYIKMKEEWKLFFAWLLLVILLLLSGLSAQTYTVGDTINNFGETICVNDSGFEDGYWDYNTDGLHKIVWMNLFTSW